nr:hypothetical protein [Tanacetum cinerariifolium]
MTPVNRIQWKIDDDSHDLGEEATQGSLHHKFGRALVFFHKNKETFIVSVKNVIELRLLAASKYGTVNRIQWKIDDDSHDLGEEATQGSLHHKFGRALVFFHKNKETFIVSVKNVIELRLLAASKYGTVRSLSSKSSYLSESISSLRAHSRSSSSKACVSFF